MNLLFFFKSSAAAVTPKRCQLFQLFEGSVFPSVVFAAYKKNGERKVAGLYVRMMLSSTRHLLCQASKFFAVQPPPYGGSTRRCVDARLLLLLPAAQRRDKIFRSVFPPLTLIERNAAVNCATRLTPTTTFREQVFFNLQHRRCTSVLSRSQSLSPTPVSTKTVEGCAVHWSRSWLMDEQALEQIFCSNVKIRRFIDASAAYCFLCKEPLTAISTHTGGWEHVTRTVALRLAMAYERTWDPEGVLIGVLVSGSIGEQDYVRLVPSFSRSQWTLARLQSLPHPRGNRAADAIALCSRYERDIMRSAAAAQRIPLLPAEEDLASMFPSVVDPAALKRRDELRAILDQLIDGGVLAYSFSEVRAGAAGNGERCFRATVSALMNTMMPPLSAQAMTRWQQKCWGRKTLEALYDLLDVGELQRRRFKCQAATTKDQKGIVMRQLVFELHCATDMCGRDATLRREISAVRGPPGMTQVPPLVLELLSETALKRIAFELIALRTSVLMDQTSGDMWNVLGLPTSAEAMKSDFLQA